MWASHRASCFSSHRQSVTWVRRLFWVNGQEAQMQFRMPEMDIHRLVVSLRALDSRGLRHLLSVLDAGNLASQVGGGKVQFQRGVGFQNGRLGRTWPCSAAKIQSTSLRRSSIDRDQTVRRVTTFRVSTVPRCIAGRFHQIRLTGDLPLGCLCAIPSTTHWQHRTRKSRPAGPVRFRGYPSSNRMFDQQCSGPLIGQQELQQRLRLVQHVPAMA